MGPADEFSSGYGRWLTALTAVAAAAAVATLAGQVPVRDLVLAACLSGLAVLAVWALFARPRVEVSDGEVVLRNVLRTVSVPWPTLERVEVGWSLVLHTNGGRWTAWAAPHGRSPGRGVRSAHRPGDTGPARSWSAGRDADGPATAEVVAAAVERRREALRRAGHLDDAAAVAARHGIRPTVRWHRATVATAVGLAAVAALTRL